MNRPRRSTVGASRSVASIRSLSRKRAKPAGRAVPGWGRATSRPAAPADPPAIDFPIRSPLGSEDTARSGLVDLLQLRLCPLHGVLGTRALDGLGVHVGHDVLGEGL